MKTKIPRSSKDKESVRKAAIKYGRKVLWLDEEGKWHAATDRRNTPKFAIKTEDL